MITNLCSRKVVGAEVKEKESDPSVASPWSVLATKFQSRLYPHGRAVTSFTMQALRPGGHAMLQPSARVTIIDTPDLCYGH